MSTVKSAQKVPCPRCGAQKGTPCITMANGFLRTTVHTERKSAATQTKDKEDEQS